jgi:hypothetical protein
VLEPEIAELERICALRSQHNCRSAIGAVAKGLMLTSLSLTSYSFAVGAPFGSNQYQIQFANLARCGLRSSPSTMSYWCGGRLASPGKRPLLTTTGDVRGVALILRELETSR